MIFLTWRESLVPKRAPAISHRCWTGCLWTEKHTFWSLCSTTLAALEWNAFVLSEFISYYRHSCWKTRPPPQITSYNRIRIWIFIGAKKHLRMIVLLTPAPYLPTLSRATSTGPREDVLRTARHNSVSGSGAAADDAMCSPVKTALLFPFIIRLHPFTPTWYAAFRIATVTTSRRPQFAFLQTILRFKEDISNTIDRARNCIVSVVLVHITHSRHSGQVEKRSRPRTKQTESKTTAPTIWLRWQPTAQLHGETWRA